MTDHVATPSFLCDAMLGGLARWLRAAGYDAAFDAHIDDGDLVRRGAASGAIVLSSDGGVFERTVVRTAAVRALYVPRGLGKLAQLRFVLQALDLPVCEPRCMTCGGALLEVDKQTVRGEAPPRTFAHVARFWRCTRCGKLLWKGTHWTRIDAALASAGAKDA
jgi:uncharacterized protein with PIN domain